MVRYLSPEFVRLLGNPSAWHRAEKAAAFWRAWQGSSHPQTQLLWDGWASGHILAHGAFCFSPSHVPFTLAQTQPISAPFLLGHHVPLVSSAVLCAQTPSSLVRSPPRLFSLGQCPFLCSIKPLPPGGVSATSATTALFSLAMAFSIPFWQANLLLTKMLHLSHLHSLSVVIFSCFSFLLIYVSPWTPQVLLKDWSRTLQEQLSVSKYEFCCLRPRWAKR